MSENNRNPQQRRTDGAQYINRNQKRPVARRDVPKARSSAAGERPSNKGRTVNTSVARRHGSTSVQTANNGNTSLVAQIKSRALAVQRKKDEKWDNAPIERQRHNFDSFMFVIILVFVILGSMMVFSASYPAALRKEDDIFYYMRDQIIWVSLGLGAMIGISFIPYQVIKKLSPAAAVVAVILLVLVLVVGTARGVAQRWLDLGFASFQPSEPSKAALILFLAYFIDKHYDVTSKRIEKKKTFKYGIALPGVIVAVFAGLVLLEKHLSGAIILGLIGMSIIFVSGANIKHMVTCYGSVGLAGIALFVATNDYARSRITSFLDKEADVLDEAWQTTQGLYAIGSGGLLGMGLGESNLKYNYVSEAHNDFIFTIWCEELGFVGAVLLIALYGVFLWRGFLIAKRAPDTFSSLTAFGITFQVGIQAALNILVVTDIIPNTGVSLPFISYGGTALVILLAEMGILLSISKHSYQEK